MRSITQLERDSHNNLPTPAREPSIEDILGIIRSQLRTLDFRFRHGRVAATRADLVRLKDSLDEILTAEAKGERDA